MGAKREYIYVYSHETRPSWLTLESGGIFVRQITIINFPINEICTSIATYK